MAGALPVLYSFRRCPYAMRARLALAVAGIEVDLREVVLRRKPVAMLARSPKGTVPVLVLADGTVLDESIDVMRWALTQRDPAGWLSADPDRTQALIAEADGPFKHALDRYKYPDRYPDDPPADHWARAAAILDGWDERLTTHGGQLLGAEPCLADMALFPFVRQFAAVDRDRWAAAPWAALQAWLQHHLESPLFQRIMSKRPAWAPGDPQTVERWAA